MHELFAPTMHVLLTHSNRGTSAFRAMIWELVIPLAPLSTPGDATEAADSRVHSYRYVMPYV